MKTGRGCLHWIKRHSQTILEVCKKMFRRKMLVRGVTKTYQFRNLQRIYKTQGSSSNLQAIMKGSLIWIKKVPANSRIRTNMHSNSCQRSKPAELKRSSTIRTRISNTMVSFLISAISRCIRWCNKTTPVSLITKQQYGKDKTTQRDTATCNCSKTRVTSAKCPNPIWAMSPSTMKLDLTWELARLIALSRT